MYYGLGFVQESDAYRAPAWSEILEERESEDDIQPMEDGRLPPRQGSDIQARKSGEQPLEEEALRDADKKAPEAGGLAGSKT